MAQVPFDAGDGQAAKERKVKACAAFLLAALVGQQRPAAEVEAEAKAAGFTHATIQAARARAHINSQKIGKAWIWTPPKSARRKQPVTA